MNTEASLAAIEGISCILWGNNHPEVSPLPPSSRQYFKTQCTCFQEPPSLKLPPKICPPRCHNGNRLPPYGSSNSSSNRWIFDSVDFMRDSAYEETFHSRSGGSLAEVWQLRGSICCVSRGTLMSAQLEDGKTFHGGIHLSSFSL